MYGKSEDNRWQIVGSCADDLPTIQGDRQQPGAGSWRQICPPLLFAFAETNNSKIMRKSGLKKKNRAGSPQTVSGNGPCGVLVRQKAEMLKKSGR